MYMKPPQPGAWNLRVKPVEPAGPAVLRLCIVVLLDVLKSMMECEITSESPGPLYGRRTNPRTGKYAAGQPKITHRLLSE